MLSVESRRSVEEIAQRMPGVAARHGFGVLGGYDFRKRLTEKGVPFARECRVFDLCNPEIAAQVLGAKMEIATVLPCRVAAFEDGATVRIAAVPPTTMLGLFAADPATLPIAKSVESTILTIMQEVAG